MNKTFRLFDFASQSNIQHVSFDACWRAMPMWQVRSGTQLHLPVRSGQRISVQTTLCSGKYIRFLKRKHKSVLFGCIYPVCGPGSSVGIATDYGLDGPESNPGGDEIFRPSRPALGPTQPPVKWAPRLLVPRSWKSRAIPLHTLSATPGL